MAKVKLDFGAEIDLLNKQELDDGLSMLPAGVWAAYARGLKHLDLPVMAGTVDAGDLTIGSTGDPDQIWCGPRQGYVWRVTRVSVSGLAAGDTVAVYKGDPAASRFVTVLSADAPTFTASHGLLLHPDQHLVVDGSGLTATRVVVCGEAVEAPAEQVFKLIGG